MKLRRFLTLTMGLPGMLKSQNMLRERQFTAVIEKKGRWYVAYVEEIPGVTTQGRTLAEARRNLRQAIHLILATNRELAAKALSPDARRESISVKV